MSKEKKEASTGSDTASKKCSLKPDNRNLHWRQNNVGATLLQKMGWKDGQALGKRKHSGDSEEDSSDKVTTEGLRAKKRIDGLGLGASSVVTVAHSDHQQHFGALLQSLRAEHGSVDGGRSSKKKKKSKKLVLPTNRQTHARVQKAKFQTKSADDMKCIFGLADDSFLAIPAFNDNSDSNTEDVKSPKKKRKESKKKKKKTKKD